MIRRGEAQARAEGEENLPDFDEMFDVDILYEAGIPFPFDEPVVADGRNTTNAEAPLATEVANISEPVTITEGTPATIAPFANTATPLDGNLPAPANTITAASGVQMDAEEVPANEPSTEAEQEMIPALEDALDDPPTPSLE